MTLTFPNAYEYIVTFENNVTPGISWRNTVSFHSPTVPVESDGIIAALNQFFTDCVHTDVNVVQAAVYNWTRGGPSPYPSGLPLFVVPINAVGNADAAWGYTGSELGVGGEVCMRLKKTNTGGLKPGRLFMRGILREADTGAPSGGKWTLKSGTPITPTQEQLVVQNSGLINYLGKHSLYPQYLQDIAYSKKHGTVGPAFTVYDIVLDGVTTNKISRKGKK